MPQQLQCVCLDQALFVEIVIMIIIMIIIMSIIIILIIFSVSAGELHNHFTKSH